MQYFVEVHGRRRVVDNILPRGAGGPEFDPRVIPVGGLILQSLIGGVW